MVTLHPAAPRSKKAKSLSSQGGDWHNKVHLFSHEKLKPSTPELLPSYPFFPRSVEWGVTGARVTANLGPFVHYEAKPLITLGPLSTILESLQHQGIGFVCQRGKKEKAKPNQDDFFVIHGPTWTLFGVMDGHGTDGHSVSHLITRLLPTFIVDHPTFVADPHRAMRESFLKVQGLMATATGRNDFNASGDVPKWTKKIVKEANLNPTLSGAAVVVALHDHNKSCVHLAHVGDSRGLLAIQSFTSAPMGPLSIFCGSMGRVKVVAETEDHKPDRTSEKTRVENSGGEIRMADNYHGYRVFAKGLPVPGYAMTRALGDVAARTIGIIGEPEITTVDIPPDKDAVLLLASDGVFEFMDQNQLTRILFKAGKAGVSKAAGWWVGDVSEVLIPPF
eukprot:GHVN01005173.1.p1 GENE.GHVN01005173.1~~GHVN01005173.1.p1  ORF type:complete len:431 (-),score=44.45 GHVN01005173.1:1042-2214(-)